MSVQAKYQLARRRDARVRVEKAPESIKCGVDTGDDSSVLVKNNGSVVVRNADLASVDQTVEVDDEGCPSSRAVTRDGRCVR